MPANHCIPHSEETKRKLSLAKKGVPVLQNRRVPIIENGVELWTCSNCGGKFEKGAFYKNKRSWCGIKSECRKCHCQTSIRTRDYEKALTSNRLYMRRVRILHPERFASRRNRAPKFKVDARSVLNRAVRKGLINKPSHCSLCGRRGRISGHHPDYLKPLDVVWVCYLCHGHIHRKQTSKRIKP